MKRISVNLKKYIKLLICLSMFVHLISCTSKPNGSRKFDQMLAHAVKLREAKNKADAHAWVPLFSYGQEEFGYAAYSYVLVGRNKDNQQSTLIYNELIRAIKSSTVNTKTIHKFVPKDKFNVFIIPVKKNTIQKEDMVASKLVRPTQLKEKINYNLSKLLITQLSMSLPLDMTKPGPYIITLLQPVRNYYQKKDLNVDVLYINLTNAHLKAIPEIVRTYKEKILNENIEGTKKLESLRLSLLNVALLTEDSIGFAKVAYSKMKKIFSK